MGAIFKFAMLLDSACALNRDSWGLPVAPGRASYLRKHYTWRPPAPGTRAKVRRVLGS
jgi:hypothetical protein